MMSYEQDVVDGYREMEAERWAAAHFLCVECGQWKPWFRSRSGSPEGMLRMSRAEDVLRSTAETKTAPGFCSECLMTGGHKLSCSKAETAPANSWYCTCGRKNTGLMTMCECGASLTATAKETEVCPTCGCAAQWTTCSNAWHMKDAQSDRGAKL